MPLFGDRACMVDRYDVRLLLDDTSLPELLQVTPQPWELEEGGDTSRFWSRSHAP